MSMADYAISQYYDDVIQRATGSEETWREICQLTGRIYRYEFENILLIYDQKPQATLVADFDSWKKVDRFVKRGSKGIAIYSSRALKPYVRYVFDISSTGGRNQKLTWSLEGENLKDYLLLQKRENRLTEDISEDREQMLSQFKDFTKGQIREIIKEDFDERISEVVTLTGRVIIGEEKETSELAAMTLIQNSILLAVGTRCGFSLTSEEQELGMIVNVTDEDHIYALGSLVCDVSCTVLRNINYSLSQIERERRMYHGSIRTELPRGNGRDAISQLSSGGKGTTDTREIRNHGDGISEREPLSEIPTISETGQTSRKDENRGGGSEPVAGTVGGRISEEAQAKQSTIHDGDVEDQRTSDANSRGNRHGRDHQQVSLESEKKTSSEVEQELNKELDELDSFGMEKREAGYHQASLFDFGDSLISGGKNGQNSQYTYVNPKKENVVPHEYIVEMLLRGSGFEGGKKRIYAMYQEPISKEERAKRIKKEYGQGGAGWPLDGYGLHGYDSFQGKGIRLQWRDAEGEKEGYVSWRSVETEIGALLLTGQYYQPEPKEEVVDVEYQEVALEDSKKPEREESAEPQNILEKTEEKLDDDQIEKILEADREHLEERNQKQKQLLENFRIVARPTESAGAKTRFGWNMVAIKTLKQLEKENRNVTKEEQEILARYVGWGGLSQAFDERNESWSSEYRELKELLTEAEYHAARETVNTAFYTPTEVIQAMYTALIRFGFTKGNVLEPSMAIGNFFGAMPEHLSQNCNLFGVEKDDISGRIAKQLYPKAKVQIKGFEDVEYGDNFFDVVVGNVPFGDYKIYDRKHNPQEFKIHDYFIAKSIDEVRPGGIVAVITTKGTMDKQNTNVRKYLAQRAELVGAIRLPNTAFKTEAGTEVTSDILFFQKRERIVNIDPDWVHLGMTEEGIPVNQYFAQHPEMILGRMEYDKGRFGEQSKVTRCVNEEEDFSLYEALQQAVMNIEATITDFAYITEQEEIGETEETEVIPADPDVKNFTYTFIDGKLYFRKDSSMYFQKVGEKPMERIKGMHLIREATRHLIDIQMEGCMEDEFKTAQAKLNEVYDEYVKKYGTITSQGNSRVFRDDADYPLLCSLEVVDEDGKVSKADMFHKQTIRPKNTVDRVENAVEALHVCVNEFGSVNLPFMLSIYEPDISKEYEKVAKELDMDLEQMKKNFPETVRAELKRQKLVEELEGVIFLNPKKFVPGDESVGWETADEYLSGNVRDKLRVAKASATEFPLIFSGNVAALEKVQPKDLDASEIDVRIGTTWIEPQDYEAFIFELLQTPNRARAVRTEWYNSGIQVHLNKYSMEWFIENKGKDKYSIAATKTYGTSRMDAYTIFENTLNLRTVTVRDRIEDGDGKYHYEVNQKETMLAREKQDQMKEAFREWIFKEPKRRAKYVEYYNETFNHTRLREYDGSHLEFPGMNPDIHLKPHQVNAVARVLMGGNTLLAHCVGAGKSFEMMAACMEQKRLGLANKTAMIVPKSLIGQTASEFLRLYPSANILVATERDFEKSRRRQFISRIATGDYDCIIMSHSQFEKIPISQERKEALLNRQIDEMSHAIAELKEKNSERWTIKQMEANKKRLEEQLKKMTDETRKDDLITFEELGIDSIMVDEAHAFKNLAIFSKMNVAGITGTGSQRAMDMFLKCEYINEVNQGRGIVFATGTPISNSMCEMYVMQAFLQKDTLEQMGIYHFDSWAANFGEQTTALELTVEGSGFRFKTRFNKFTNLPELMNLFREIADVQTRDMLDLDVPRLRDGKYKIVESEPDWYVKQVMETFVERAERIRGGGVDPSEDNFLKITHEARLLGTDARLLTPDAPNSVDGKLNKVVENVLYEYKKAEQEGVIGTQLIFSDIGTPKGKWREEMLTTPWHENGEFDVYNYIKTELVKQGIPAEEIAYIHDAKTDAAKDALFREMRAGTKKVLLGSTDKCGTGVNVQTHLVAMHHVDCPWKPSSIEQREGRGLRQGNENKEVAVYRYVTKQTFDAYSWSLVENKQRFISQVMTSKTVSRTCEDIDEATLSYAEIKAVATGNPLIKEKMELDNEVQKLKVLKASYDSQKYSLQDQFMIKFPKLIAKAEEKLRCVQTDVKQRDEELLKAGAEEFCVKVGNISYSERVDGGTAYLSAVSAVKMGETATIGTYRGFELMVEKNFMGTDYMVLRGRTDYKAELSTSPVGCMVKLENLFNGMQGNIEFVEKKLEEYQRDMEQAKLEYEKPFQYETELREKLARQNALNAQLDLENKPIKEEQKEEKTYVAEEQTSYRTERKDYR